jgi:hypothetical protein
MGVEAVVTRMGRGILMAVGMAQHDARHVRVVHFM